MRIHSRIACLIAIGLVASLVLAACTGGKASGPRLRADVTYEEIAAVLFDAGDLPPELAHLQADPENPIRETEESVLEGSFDIEDDRKDLEFFGWEAEWYTQFTGSADSIDVFYAGSRASSYETVEGATGAFRDELAEANDFAGRTNANGTKFVAAEEFGVDGLGEEAIGLRYAMESDDTEYYVHVVAFRVDRLIGAVALATLEQKDMRSTLLRLAGVLGEKFDSLVEA